VPADDIDHLLENVMLWSGRSCGGDIKQPQVEEIASAIDL